MKTVTCAGGVHPDAMAYDVAERKGIGHPDSLADLVADAFSRRYAAICMERFGAIPNHWVDKVTLVGAAARVRYGGYSIHKPVDCYLFGKVTARIGSEDIDLDEMFRQVIHRTLPAALGSRGILPHVRTHVNNTSGSATDHDPEFYAPSSAHALRHVLARESVANDTVICTGASSHGLAGRTAVWLETLINATDFRERFPMVGSDVKVMVTRVGDDIDVTAAIPAHPQAVVSWDDYRDQLAYVDVVLSGELKEHLESDGRGGAIRLHINTKDGSGGAYLAPFGTSLGKGDCGAVGRGNRGGGVIEPLRPSGCEAPAGKNPVHHVGKIYTALARQTAQRIHRELGHFTEVTVAARNGDPLDDPAFVFITLPDVARRSEQSEAEQIAAETLAAAPDFCARFMEIDPVTAFHRQVTDDPARGSHVITVDNGRRFQTDGYLILPERVPEPVLARLRYEAASLLDRLVADMDATGESDPRVTWWRLPSGEPYLFKVKPVFDLSPTAQQLGHSPELTATAAELLGGRPRLMEEKITYKQRVPVTRDWASLRVLGEEVHKHSDAAYFHARGFHDPIVTLAICLDDAPGESGAVRVWPGTHRQHIPHVPTKDHGPVVPDAAAPDEASVTLAASAGSVLAWDARLVHSSGPNTTGNPRRLLILGYTRSTPGSR